MRQTLTVAAGASIVGAQLPDGSGPVAASVDNASDGWYQVYPGGGTVAPGTMGVVLSFPGEAPAVDLRFMAAGPSGEVSTATGGTVMLTLYDAAEAPSGAEGVPLSTPVNVTGGVSITGTANVNIANTPAVTISGTPSVNVGNTPAVTVSGGTISANISAGTVDIQNVTGGIISAAGNLTSVGHIQKGAWLPIVIDPLVRALVIIPDAALVGLPIAVSDSTPGTVNPLSSTIQSTQPLVCYVNAAYVLTWYLLLSTVGDFGTAGAQVFTDTALPITDIVRAGQQAMAQSIPVAIASDQSPIATGPAYSASGLATPPAGGQASVVFGATAGKRNVLRMLVATFRQTAAVAGATGLVVRDGASGVGPIIMAVDMAVTGVINAKDAVLLDGLRLAGSINTQMAVEFQAGVAGVNEYINAAVSVD